MPYAVTLPLDEASAAAVRRLWQELDQQVGAGDILHLGYAPHITLAILPGDAPLPAIEAAALRLARGSSPIPTRLSGIGVFPNDPPVLWLAPVVTQALLGLHRSLLAAMPGLPVHPHYRPDQWVPHVSLTKAAGVSMTRAVAVVNDAWSGPLDVRLDHVEVVKFRPVTILRRAMLSGPE